jgi:hypothetical protein
MDRKNKKTILLMVLTALLISICVIVKLNISGSISNTNSLTKNKTQSSINVSVDPRIELYSVILQLSDFRGFPGADVLTDFDFPYKQEVISRFSPFKQHQAVKLYNELSKKGFWFGHPPSAMLHLSNPPELDKKYPVDKLIIKLAGGNENLDNFFECIRQFSNDSNFMDFFQAHKKIYDKWIQDYEKSLNSDWICDLEQYFGCSQNSYNIILAPLFHAGGFGPRARINEGVYDAYLIGGPSKVYEDSLIFGSIQHTRLFWHEFSHSFVNYLTDSYIEQLKDACLVLQPGVKEKLKEQGMNEDWWDIHISDWVSEHIVRGVTTRLSYLKSGEETGNSILRDEIRAGFPYVGEICKSLEIYEKKRDFYPTIKDYYPEIIKVFKELAEKNK